MLPRDIKNAEKLVVYLVDCTLATVADMAMKKSRPVYEYQRQKNIAQRTINHMEEMHISPEGSRAEDILGKMSVNEWAAKFEVPKRA